MSNRTIVELNHDYCPREQDLLEWAQHMRMYMGSGIKDTLPKGVEFIEQRHHSDKSLTEKLEEAQKEITELRKNVKRMKTLLNKQYGQL